jgi:hypothetical protein
VSLSGNDCQNKVVSELLNLPDVPGKCPRAIKPAQLRDREQHDRERVVRLSCRTWTCPICSFRLLAHRGAHFGTMLLFADGVLFEATSAAADWQCERERLHRHRASWVRVGQLHEDGVLIGSCPSPFGVALSDREQAVIRLGKALARLPLPLTALKGKRLRPVTQSGDWDPPAKEPRYELVGWVRARDPEQILSRLAALGIAGKVRPGDGCKMWDVVYQIPPFWGNEERGRLGDVLRSGQCYR